MRHTAFSTKQWLKHPPMRKYCFPWSRGRNLTCILHIHCQEGLSHQKPLPSKTYASISCLIKTVLFSTEGKKIFLPTSLSFLTTHDLLGYPWHKVHWLHKWKQRCGCTNTRQKITRFPSACACCLLTEHIPLGTPTFLLSISTKCFEAVCMKAFTSKHFPLYCWHYEKIFSSICRSQGGYIHLFSLFCSKLNHAGPVR